jgi:hypothetical protein
MPQAILELQRATRPPLIDGLDAYPDPEQRERIRNAEGRKSASLRVIQLTGLCATGHRF